MYLTSCGEDFYQASIHSYCLPRTPLVKVVKYLLVVTVNKKLCLQFPDIQVVAYPLIFSNLVYVLS